MLKFDIFQLLKNLDKSSSSKFRNTHIRSFENVSRKLLNLPRKDGPMFPLGVPILRGNSSNGIMQKRCVN